LAALALGASAGAAPAPTTYRVIPLSPAASNADINAAGQVAFTEFLGTNARGIFFDGRTRRDIGTLGGAATAISAINDAGQITGTSATRTEGVGHAFRWSKSSGMIDLAGAGAGNSVGYDINSKGWVSGAAEFSPRRFTAFRWTPTTGLVNLGSLNMSSSGFALNDAGTVVGGSESVEGGLGQNAVRWPGTTPIAITPFATPFSAAWDINNAGQIVGNGGLDPGFSDRAFLWSAKTGIVDLGVSAADVASAEQINEQGLVIGNLYSPGSSRGFFWSRATGPIVFGTLNTDVTDTADLNQRGQVVGSFNGRAFVWTLAGGLVDLNTRLANAPPDLELGQALAISDNGSIVAAGNTGLVLLVPAGAYGQAPVAGPVKLTGTPRAGALLSFSAAFKDVDVRDTHTAVWSWGDGSKTAGTVSEKNGAGSVSGQHAYRAAGIYTVKLTVTDSSGKSSTVQRTVVVCASGATMIAGEGLFASPREALKLASPRAGIAQFAFLAEGNGKVAVQFDVAGIAFRSTTISSVTLGEARLQFGGSGTVNGKNGYRFTLAASEGTRAADGRHRFGIRISHVDPVTRQEVVDYDNRSAAQDGSAVIGGGTMLLGAQ
jgi:probable HAF family extracellular repeat protein